MIYDPIAYQFMGSSATTEQFQPWALCGDFFAQLMS